MKIRIFKDYLTLLKIITHFGISPIFGGRHFRGGTLPHTLHAGKKYFICYLRIFNILLIVFYPTFIFTCNIAIIKND